MSNEQEQQLSSVAEARLNGRMAVFDERLTNLTNTVEKMAHTWEKQRQEDREELRDHRKQEQKIWDEVTNKLGAQDTKTAVFYERLKPIYKFFFQILLNMSIVIIGAVLSYLFISNNGSM